MTSIRRSIRNSRTLTLAAALGLALLVSACSSGPTDNSNPAVHITSGTSATTANYELTGVAFDNVGIAELSYALAGSEAQSLLHSDGSFSVSLTLAPGANAITVSATDAAGNAGSDSVTVQYSAPPTGAATSQDIAARGDTITISGNNFGTSGDVSIGDVPASADAWSESEITLTIPDSAPGGPQTISVTSPHGTSNFDLFIGVDYPAGTLDDLAALGLPKGTAVRLGAGTFSQASSQLILDNLSLYGQGESETVVTTGASPQVMLLRADDNQDLVLTNLTLETDAMFIGPSAPGSIGSLGTLSGGTSELPAAAELYAAVEAQLLSRSADLTTQANPSGSLTFRNVTIEEIIGGTGLVTMNLLDLGIYNGSVSLDSVDFSSSTNILALLVGGGITITDSAVNSGGYGLIGASGTMTVSNSNFIDNGFSGGTFGLGGLLYGSELRVVDSHFLARMEGFYILPASMMTGGGLPIGSSSMDISGSTFQILDPDPAAATAAGTLQIGSWSGVSSITDSRFVVQRELQIMVLGGNLDFNSNAVSMGLAAIASSPITVTQSELSSFVDFRHNTIDWVADGALSFTGMSGALLDSNTLDGNSGTALTLEQTTSGTPVDFSAQNNTFRGFTEALYIELAGASSGGAAELQFNGNVFDFPVDAAGKVATLRNVVDATIDADGNRWGTEDDLTVLNSYIDRLGSTPADMMQINSVMP